MGKRIISQNRGRGTPTYRAPSHKYKADLRHPRVDENITLTGKVVGIEHDPARSAPIAKVAFEKEEIFLLASEGIAVGNAVECGDDAEVKPGNIVPIGKVPEGFFICNIESKPNDGGKFVRSSGVYATIVTHEPGRTAVAMPSGSIKWLNPSCRAVVGVVAGGGRVDRPWLKAGKKYPRVSGVAMNPRDHPFGGGAWKHPGKPTTVSRNAPPGRKVGLIAARRTGMKR
jgi:large subunit ribosomal protein L2